MYGALLDIDGQLIRVIGESCGVKNSPFSNNDDSKNHYKIGIQTKEGYWMTDYWTPVPLSEEKANGLISGFQCLINDARSYADFDLPEFEQEFGYEEGSREGWQVYEKCKIIFNALKKHANRHDVSEWLSNIHWRIEEEDYEIRSYSNEFSPTKNPLPSEEQLPLWVALQILS